MDLLLTLHRLASSRREGLSGGLAALLDEQAETQRAGVTEIHSNVSAPVRQPVAPPQFQPGNVVRLDSYRREGSVLAASNVKSR